MTPRRLYLATFIALGWLAALGIAFHFGLTTFITRAYNSLASRIEWLSQKASDVEGNALTRIRHGARRDYMEPMRALLADINALRNPKQMLFGAYDGGFPRDTSGFSNLEEKLNFRFPIISFYAAWGDKAEQQFPTRMVESIDRLGSVPMITWEPWVTDFDPKLRPNLPSKSEREYASLAAIGRGDYDFYVTAWAKGAARFKKPIFLRFAHEMNDPYRYPWGPQNGNQPADFIKAWRRVHGIFQKMGAQNVLWVWSPHISMPWFEFYYPGDDYVDWVGVGVLNYGSAASWSRWWSFHQILEKAWPALVNLKKPIMVCELGTIAEGGDVLEWYRQAFYHLDHTYGRIRAVIFFNQTADMTTTSTPLNWSVLQDPRATQFLSRELARMSANSPP